MWLMDHIPLGNPTGKSHTTITSTGTTEQTSPEWPGPEHSTSTHSYPVPTLWIHLPFNTKTQSLSASISSQLTLEPTGPPLQGTYWVKQSIPDFFTITVSKAGTTELASNTPALWVSAVCLGIDSFLAALMTSWPLQIRRKTETLLFVEKILKECHSLWIPWQPGG